MAWTPLSNASKKLRACSTCTGSALQSRHGRPARPGCPDHCRPDSCFSSGPPRVQSVGGPAQPLECPSLVLKPISARCLVSWNYNFHQEPRNPHPIYLYNKQITKYIIYIYIYTYTKYIYTYTYIYIHTHFLKQYISTMGKVASAGCMSVTPSDMRATRYRAVP